MEICTNFAISVNFEDTKMVDHILKSQDQVLLILDIKTGILQC